MSEPEFPELEPIAPMGVAGAEPTAAGSAPGDGTEGGPPPSDGEPAPKPVWKSWVAAGVVAAAFVGGGILAVTIAGHGKDSPTVQTASAAQQTPTNAGPNGAGPSGAGRFNGRFGGRGTQGKITGITGTTLTLERTDFSGTTSTMTVTTDADTKVTETVSGAVSDIAAGDNILVVGTANAGAVTATTIVDNGDQALSFRGRAGENAPAAPDGSGATPPSQPNGAQRGPGFSGDVTAGTVTNVNGATITLKTIAGDAVTVTTTSDTTVTVTKSIKVSDLAVGDTIRVEGTTNGTTVAADAIRKGDLGFGGGLRRPDGMRPDGSQRGAVPGAATS